MGEKCFVITGATRGLGKAMKDFILSNTNHQVISLSRSKDTLDENRGKFKFIYFDLLNFQDLGFVQTIKNEFPAHEIILVNNAAVIHPLVPVEKLKDKEVSSHFQVNVLAPILLIKEFVTVFKNHRLSILNISSGAASKPIAHWSMYCTSKAAIKMFCEVLAIDHPELNVINIDPGVINTNMQQMIRDSEIPDIETFVDYSEAGRLRDPLDVAKELLTPLL